MRCVLTLAVRIGDLPDASLAHGRADKNPVALHFPLQKFSCRPPRKSSRPPESLQKTPLCDVQEPSEPSRHTCGTSLESSLLCQSQQFHSSAFCLPIQFGPSVM